MVLLHYHPLLDLHDPCAHQYPRKWGKLPAKTSALIHWCELMGLGHGSWCVMQVSSV